MTPIETWIFIKFIIIVLSVHLTLVLDVIKILKSLYFKNLSFFKSWEDRYKKNEIYTYADFLICDLRHCFNRSSVIFLIFLIFFKLTLPVLLISALVQSPYIFYCFSFNKKIPFIHKKNILFYYIVDIPKCYIVLFLYKVFISKASARDFKIILLNIHNSHSWGFGRFLFNNATIIAVSFKNNTNISTLIEKNFYSSIDFANSVILSFNKRT